MHGLVLLDEEDNVIRPAILWNDDRTQKQTEYLNTVIGQEKLSRFALDIPDFLVEVEEGREPVVLQITDPQIMPGYGDVETKCYAYLRETINATNPDLILATGDLIYGEFDHDGAGFVDFVEFMDSFEIPLGARVLQSRQ